MPVMMTSSGECCAAREAFFPLPFDFFGVWPGGLRAFINWIVAFRQGLRFASGLPAAIPLGLSHSAMANRNLEIQIVSRLQGQVSYGFMKKFEDLTEREVLALAIGLEEEDERVYADFADGLRQDYPATASMFDGMRTEESIHRRRLLELYREKFGDHIPLLRRQDVRGFVSRKPVWLVRPLGLDAVRKQGEWREGETRGFYE